MTSMDLLEAIGSIPDRYIPDADNTRAENKTAKTKQIPFAPLRMAAVIALIAAGLLFLQTPMGAAAVEIIKTQVANLIESLFPARNLIVVPEGSPEMILHEAQGRDPVENTQGFVIYVDTESYTMTEEAGVYYVRPLSVGADLPVVEIEIREVTDRDYASYAEDVQQQMAGTWDVARTVHWTDRPVGYAFSLSGGNVWDSPCEDHYFIDNGKDGTFHIISRYFLEAAGGHGVRFATMIQTFSIVTGEQTDQYAADSTTVRSAMAQKVAEVRAQSNALLLEDGDVTELAQERYRLWLDAFDTLWVALEQTLDAESMANVTAQQLEWSAWKINEQNLAAAQAGSEELADAVFYDKGAELLEPCVDRLLNLLEGNGVTFAPAPATPPEAVVRDFMDAYFTGDREKIEAFLSDSFPWDVEVYPDHATAAPVINAIKGLDHVIHDMADRGRICPSVEFRHVPDSDYYIYLSITMVWEEGQWKITGYGLEG